ncbi:hypothetical protein [Polynucleobacter sp. P1-05-14]|uniref:hypothetical protein n=1 Tax=Polynucleobacter sp. P1-05-14 TaxID=1819732 RepID=UPI001C0AC8DD|nr:hypothetical protein [Polynucleobacter sp. P1-05-14]MBU3548873.1 hypothetical protein [Polynucleobacter sp. P1-05-14]
MSIKKLLVALSAVLLAGMSTQIMAAIVPYVNQVSGNEYAYFNGTSTTNYDLSTVIYNGSNSAQITTGTPWWSNASVANLFAVGVGGNLGYPNTDSTTPFFQYNSNSYSVWLGGSNSADLTNSYPLSSGTTYAVATVHSSGAPEIDGSLAPKVAFLLGCLFLMFGRKKQNTEPMMTA